MRNIKLIMAYDGSSYYGFQVQKQGPTIQEVLEKALRELTGERIRVTPAAGPMRGSMPSVRWSISARNHPYLPNASLPP